MKLSWKRAFFVGGFLGGLCAVLGLAIAGGDMLTKQTIARNKSAKEEAGLKKAFAYDGAAYSDPVEIPGSDRLSKYWTVRLGEEELGRVYSVAGTNSYGNVALLVGLDFDYSLYGVVVLENTQSFGQTLEEEYLDPLSSAEDKESVVDKVNCGATFGAKLCRDMINEAKAHYQEDKQ